MVTEAARKPASQQPGVIGVADGNDLGLVEQGRPLIGSMSCSPQPLSRCAVLVQRRMRGNAHVRFGVGVTT